MPIFPDSFPSRSRDQRRPECEDAGRREGRHDRDSTEDRSQDIADDDRIAPRLETVAIDRPYHAGDRDTDRQDGRPRMPREIKADLIDERDIGQGAQNRCEPTDHLSSTRSSIHGIFTPLECEKNFDR